MLDPHKTGAYISRLRHEKDWTQLELAERLHVTPQAVSRWETGDSFPDISTLAQLARLFLISVDDLLRGERSFGVRRSSKASPGEVLGELAEGHPENVVRLVREEKVDVDIVIEAGPLTRPSLMDKVVGELVGYPFSPGQILKLAPFIGQEALAELVKGLDFDMLDQELVTSLAPFLGEGLLDELAERVIKGEIDPMVLVRLAPFLGDETLNRLVERIKVEILTEEQIIGLAPFLRQEALDRLVDQVIEGKVEPGLVVSLAPFLGESALERLVFEHSSEDPVDLHMVEALAPFLTRSALDRLVERIGPGEMRGKHLVVLAPFINSGTMNRILEGMQPGSLTPEAIIDLSPFLDKDTLRRMLGNISPPDNGPPDLPGWV